MDIPIISLDGLPKIRFKVDTLSFYQGFTKQSVILVPKEKLISKRLFIKSILSRVCYGYVRIWECKKIRISRNAQYLSVR